MSINLKRHLGVSAIPHHVGPAKSDEQIYDEEYAKFVASMVQYCKCEIDQPCDGVLAGGLCDQQKEHRDSMDDRDEDSGINVENL
jgi:hypothetical protein